MGDTLIQWCGKVWNPVTGCTPISPGCQNCYAKKAAEGPRLRGKFGYPADEPFRVTLHRDRLYEPTHWRKPRRIFVCSMGDLFHKDVPDAFIWDVLRTALTGNRRHTYLVLTKRPDRMKQWFERYSPEFWHYHAPNEPQRQYVAAPWPDPQLWLGVTAENQEQADKRIPILLGIPAAVRFVSCEPLLSEVDLTDVGEYGDLLSPECWGDCACDSVFGADPGCRRNGGDGMLTRKVDLVIAGCESGPRRRPSAIAWFRKLRDDCQAAGTPYFLKQMEQGGKVVKMPELDGVVHNAMPGGAR